MHTISTASMGAFTAKAIFSHNPLKSFYLLAGISCAVSIHFVWNLSVSFDFSWYLGLVLMAILISLFITYFLRQRTIERRIIVNELREECDEGIIPYHHLPILTSKMKDKKGWISEDIRNDYTNTAIKLAFRKNQLKKKLKDAGFFEKETAYYRNKLIELSNKDGK